MRRSEIGGAFLFSANRRDEQRGTPLLLLTQGQKTNPLKSGGNEMNRAGKRTLALFLSLAMAFSLACLPAQAAPVMADAAGSWAAGRAFWWAYPPAPPSGQPSSLPGARKTGVKPSLPCCLIPGTAICPQKCFLIKSIEWIFIPRGDLKRPEGFYYLLPFPRLIKTAILPDRFSRLSVRSRGIFSASGPNDKLCRPPGVQ